MKLLFDVHGPADPDTSFGLLLEHVVVALHNAGHDVRVIPSIKAPGELQHALTRPQLSPIVRACIDPTSRRKARRVCVFPVGWHDEHVLVPGAYALVTLWETSWMPAPWVKAANEANMVVTFSKWGKRVMLDSHLKRPVKIMPLGVNPIYGLPTGLPTEKTFLTMGRCWSGNKRKGLDLVMAAFLAHASRIPDTKLIIKGAEGDSLGIPHPRVHIIKEQLPLKRMLQLYAGCLCYVSGVASEGWGWHPHEAMMCGRPVIGHTWGGMGEFFKGNRHGWEIGYQMEDAHDDFHDDGKWTRPSIDNMVAAMDEVATNPYEAMMRGLCAHQDVRHLTEKLMHENFVKLLV